MSLAPRLRLERVAFRTSRLLDFVGQRELVAQIGHSVNEWPLVVLKELVDNAIDACEEADAAPRLEIEVSTAERTIRLADNGPGIASETIDDILDYTVRVSSREAYVSPTRGAQGNALKTILAMGFALSGEHGETMIESRGVAHRIVFCADQIRQEPRIDRTESESLVKNGASITVRWPESACSTLEHSKLRFLQIAQDFTWCNPHLRLSLRWDSESNSVQGSSPAWKKWRPSDPTPAHWYDAARLERLIAAHITDDEDHGRTRTVREFISEFRGLSGSAKQKAVLDEAQAARLSLAEFSANGNGEINHAATAKLLDAMRKHTRPPKAKDLGVIGKEHLASRFAAVGVHTDTFQYKAVIGDAENGVPVVIETAFGWCPKGESRRIITGVNFSVALGNPFRSFGQTGEGLERMLAQQRVGSGEPIVFFLHLASPRVEFADRGKTSLVIGEQSSPEDADDEDMKSEDEES
jgi:DNA topoisomerase VI subunit B